jgi:Integrase core domain
MVGARRLGGPAVDLGAAEAEDDGEQAGAGQDGAGGVDPLAAGAGAGAVADDQERSGDGEHGQGQAESFFSPLKGELADTRAWPTRAGARRAIVEYIAWCNGTRLHSSLGYQSPADYENSPHENVRRVA